MTYETTAGLPSRGDTFKKLLDSLREAQDAAAMLSHLDGLNDKVAVSRGWLIISDMLKSMIRRITMLGQGRLQ